VTKRGDRRELPPQGLVAGVPGRWGPVPAMTRFAGYASPRQLAADPWLSREEKVSGLQTWREAAVRGVPGPERERLIVEIDRALQELATERSGGDQP
jgi:hypothetical protein